MPWDTATLIQVLCDNIMYAWLLVEREDAVLSWDSPELSPILLPLCGKYVVAPNTL